MSWTNAYVGIPYLDRGRTGAGCDCWGLARMVYARELAIDLPSYLGAYVSAEEQTEVAVLIANGRIRAPWQPVTRIAPFDLLLFRRGVLQTHIGIAVSAEIMLHIEGSDQAKLVTLNAPRWTSRFTGAFRHIEGPLKGMA